LFFTGTQEADMSDLRTSDSNGTRGAGDRVAVVTGASQGLGFALAAALVGAGWSIVVDARRADRLERAVATFRRASPSATVIGIAGDVTDPAHRKALSRAASTLGPVGLLVNNASTLGTSPLARLDGIDPDIFRSIFDVNVVAPIALVGELADHLAPGATILNITSDAGVEAYETWGGYGASKAALEHASRVLAVERPDLRVLVVDPGDMRTEMHQDAFPGEDISDRPDPAEVVPALVNLIEGDQPSGRYEARAMTSAEPR
jgi:NAD(P)-dependent dehydrogenase (short-subunit alcohol dehydrogenase family)